MIKNNNIADTIKTLFILDLDCSYSIKQSN